MHLSMYDLEQLNKKHKRTIKNLELDVDGLESLIKQCERYPPGYESEEDSRNFNGCVSECVSDFYL